MPLYISVVSVTELVFSAVDQKASPELSVDCVTPPDPVARPLNSTRSHSADSPSQLGGLDELVFIHLKTKAFQLKYVPGREFLNL